MQLGIRSSIGPAVDRFTGDHLARFTDHGFGLVELNFNHPTAGLDPHDTEQADQLRGAADRMNTRLLAHAPDRLSLSLPEREKVVAHTSQYQHLLEGMARFGVEGVVIHACGYDPLIPAQKDEQRQNLLEALHTLAPLCERLEVSLRVETLVPGRLTAESQTVIEIVQEVGSPRVGVCLDTNHINIDESLPEAIATVAPRLDEVHLNDNHGEREEHLLPYRGTIDWSRVARSLAAARFAGPIVMEPGGFGDRSLNDVLHQAREAADRFAAEMDAVFPAS